MEKIPEYKKELVNNMVKLIRQYPIIGIVNMQNLPAPQLQSMKAELRGNVNLFMTKKRLMKIAIDRTKNEKKNIAELEKYFTGMPAFIFTNENPFKLGKMLQKSKTSAPAKAGQIAPADILVRKGPTPFAPGPIISELSSVGIKVGVESGKIAVKEDAVIAKKGDKIKPKVAEILTRLDIKPMQVGLDLIVAYEDGFIYQKDVLEVDEKAFNEKMNLAATEAFNLAFEIAYTTKENIGLLLSKAFNDAKALGISQKILDRGIIEELLSEAEMGMLSLKNSANIEIKEKKPEETPKEEIKQEELEKEKQEINEEPEVKKESAMQKEEKVLEEEKEIIEEEKNLEEEKTEETPAEKEVREAVKEEEEEQLEQERIKKEKEFEKAEKEKAKEFQTVYDFKKQRDEKEIKEIREDKERKEVEELTKELLKKGTLRKK